VCYNINIFEGRVRFLTGSKACEPHKRLIRCDPGADGIVRMKEDAAFTDAYYPSPGVPGIFCFQEAFL